MIISKKDAKQYGAVHIDNYIDFIGFCKNVDNSDDICDVDIFIDGKIIDTVKANQNIKKMNLLYDIDGFAFSYILDEQYFKKQHTIEFKSKNNDNLVNSGIKTICKNDKHFNEYKFLHSLNNIDENKLETLYTKNIVGFIADEDNLNDKEFIEYIKQLYTKFPQVRFKAFYFTTEQKQLINNVFVNEINRFELTIPTNIYEVSSQIEVYIFNNSFPENFRKLFVLFKRYASNIGAIQVIQSNKQHTLKSLKGSNHPLLSNPEYFGYTRNDVIKSDENIFTLFYKDLLFENLNVTLDLNTNAYDFYYFDCVEYILKNENIKKVISLNNKKVIEILGL